MSICAVHPGVALYEVVAGSGHTGAAVGFGLAFAAQKLASTSHSAVLWVREGAAARETGTPYGPGLTALGLPPDRLLLARLRTRTDALRAALEGARCAALGAVVLETTAHIDLTASRRLKLAAEKSRNTVVLVRLSAHPVSNAVQIRWSVCGAALPAQREADQRPAFEVTLLKHPRGRPERRCIVEWDHERHCFAETLSLPVAAVPGGGSMAA